MIASTWSSGAPCSMRNFRVNAIVLSVISTPTWIDLKFRYMPYKLFSLVKKML